MSEQCINNKLVSAGLDQVVAKMFSQRCQNRVGF
jgi:hypothetical protein